MRIETTDPAGPRMIEPAAHGDERGFFLELYRQDLFEQAGLNVTWVQDNHSRSRRGIVRGMHFQVGQIKLVSCARGAIFDVLVDVRSDSPRFGAWQGFRLDDEDHRLLYVPDGFAHGFCVLSELADVIYKVSTLYDPDAESGFVYDDPAVGIEWPDDIDLLVSARDRSAPTLSEIRDSLRFRYDP